MSLFLERNCETLYLNTFESKLETGIFVELSVKRLSGLVQPSLMNLKESIKAEVALRNNLFLSGLIFYEFKQ